MDILIDFTFGSQTIAASPASCSITRSVCSESLQHVEDSCQVKLVYDPDLFALIASSEEFGAVVRDAGGDILFTGMASAETSWTDEGEPYPIEGLSLSIKDYTSKLDAKNGAEIALLNKTLPQIIAKIAADCGLTPLLDAVPATTLPAFIVPVGQNYRQTLDNLCYQYRLAFHFDNLGRLAFFNFGAIPQAISPLGAEAIMSGLQSKKSRKRYDAVQIGYNTLTTKANEQVYYESFGYNSDSSPAPAILQPGAYYPFESDPIIEAAEGRVYQSFESGYAESRKKYNGELEYRRSKETTLLYTQNHTVVQDWEGPISVNRTGFETQRASVRFRNTGSAEAKLRQFAIRADATYRNAAGYVTAGSGSQERTFASDVEYIYSAEHAEALARALCRYLSKSNYSLSFCLDAALIAPGTFRHIDSGLSGFAVDALLLSYTLDCETELYAYKAISVGGAAVDVSRYKYAQSDPAKGDKGEAGRYTDFMFAKSSSLTQAPPHDQHHDSPGEAWADGPPELDATEYLWMTKSDWLGSERQTAWSAPARISGPAGTKGDDGADGGDAYLLDLSNEFIGLSCNSAGIPAAYTAITLNATLYKGAAKVKPSTLTVSPAGAGVTIGNLGTDTVITLAANTNPSADVTKFEFTANGVYKTTLTVSKIKAGLSVNQIVTPSFENGSAGAWGNEEIANVTGQTFTKAMKITQRAVEQGINRTIPIVEGSTYLFSAWVNTLETDYATGIGLVANKRNPDGSISMIYATGAAVGAVGGRKDCTLQKSEYTFPEGVFEGTIRVHNDGNPTPAGQYALITDMVIKEVSAPAVNYSLIPSVSAISKSPTGAYTPATITAAGYRKTGTANPVAYAGRWKVETTTNGTTWTATYTGTADVAAMPAYTVPAGIAALRITLYLAGGTTVMLDQETIPIVADGDDGDNGHGGDGDNGDDRSIASASSTPSLASPSLPRSFSQRPLLPALSSLNLRCPLSVLLLSSTTTLLHTL